MLYVRMKYLPLYLTNLQDGIAFLSRHRYFDFVLDFSQFETRSRSSVSMTYRFSTYEQTITRRNTVLYIIAQTFERLVHLFPSALCSCIRATH